MVKYHRSQFSYSFPITRNCLSRRFVDTIISYFCQAVLVCFDWGDSCRLSPDLDCPECLTDPPPSLSLPLLLLHLPITDTLPLGQEELMPPPLLPLSLPLLPLLCSPVPAPREPSHPTHLQNVTDEGGGEKKKQVKQQTLKQKQHRIPFPSNNRVSFPVKKWE